MQPFFAHSWKHSSSVKSLALKAVLIRHLGEREKVNPSLAFPQGTPGVHNIAVVEMD